MAQPAFDIRSWVKDNPALYDILKRSKRDLLGKRGEPYDSLDRFSRARGGPVRFIQIGANDGLRNDPVREFVVRDGWTGVLVEPIPQIFELLKQNYPPYRFSGLHFVNAAVSAREGESLSFWSVSDEFLDRLSRETKLSLMRKASFDRDHIARFLSEVDAPANALRQIPVPCLTVEALSLRYFEGGEFDLLVVDAEGHEATIFESINFSKVKPRAIFYESHHLGSNKIHIENLLSCAGYTVRDIGGDSMAERL